MKNLFAFSFLLIFLTTSCTDETDNVQRETTAIFKNDFKNSEQMKGIFGGIRIILGKPSKGCKGFGACEVTIGVTFYDHTNHKLASNQAMALWVENNDGDFAKLELEAPISGPTDFIVEQDVIDYNAGY